MSERRDAVIARLSEAFANGDLEVDELDRRMQLAHAAPEGELDALVADLSASKALVVAAPAKLSCVLGSLERRGPWAVPSVLDARVLFGNAELDFTGASLGPGVTELDVRVTLASLEIILPPRVALELDVSSFAANVEEKHRVARDDDPDRPILRIRGSVKLGNLVIRCT